MVPVSLQCDDSLLFSVLNQLKYVWALDCWSDKKKDILRNHFALWEAAMDIFHYFFHNFKDETMNQFVPKITDRLIDK